MPSAPPQGRSRPGAPFRALGGPLRAVGAPLRKLGAPLRRLGTPLRNLRVAPKLFVGFGVVCLLLIGVGVTGIVELQRSRQRLDDMYHQSTQAIARLGEVRGDVHSGRALSSELILHSPLSDVTDVQTKIKNLDADIDEAWARYGATDGNGREQERASLVTALAEYRKVRDERLVPAAQANDVKAYLDAQSKYIEPLAGTITLLLDVLSEKEDAAARTAMAEADAAADRALTIVAALIALAVALAVGMVLLLSRAIARPLGQTVAVLEALADGRLDQRLTVTGNDEVGRMAGALNTALERLTGTLRGINTNVSTLTASSGELTAVAAQVNGSAERSATRAHAVSSASEEISQNIATVAAGAEEIGSSIAEIARSTSSAADVATRAVRISDEAGAILQKLGASSAEIVSVVKIITGIAEQTNLLALNATIEAARAGDAGKGFAVVAGEVKELAQETGRATGDISARVAAIQADSTAAVAAIAGIGAVIDQINATQTAIAAAVEEQTATTTEMSRNVTEVASGSQDISRNVAEVAEAAAETTGAAANTAHAADELSDIAHALQKNLAMFRY
jgi:methyl-accepting chemotaxis protein